MSAGGATFITSANTAIINLGTLAVTGAIALSTNGATADATIVNATAVDLATSSIGRNLDVTATTGGITDSGTLTAGGLRLVAAGAIELDTAANDVDTLAASTSAAGDFTFVDADGFTVGTVGGTTGIVLNSGSVTLSLGGQLDVDEVITAAGAGNGITVNNNNAIVISGVNLTTAGGVGGDINLGSSAVTLDAGAVQLSTGGAAAGAIVINGTVNGGQALTLTAGTGAITLGGNVGGGAALASLTASGTTISLQNVTTTGTQSYTGDVTFNSDYTTGGNDFTVTGNVSVGSASSVSTGGGAINITGTLTSGNNITLDGGAVTTNVNITSAAFGTLSVAGIVQLNGTVGGGFENIAGAALIRLISGAGFFGIVPLSLVQLDLDALIDDLASVDFKIDVNIGALTTTPAQVAFCTDVSQCAINPDIFGTDFGLLEAGGGSEDAYQASPYVGGDFWKEFLDEEEKKQ